MTTPAEEPEECQEARAAMAAFFASGFRIGDDAARQERMRRHLTRCAACSDAYAATGSTTAAFRGIVDRRALSDAARRGSWRESRPRARGMGAMGVFFAWNQKPPSNAAARVIWRLRPLLIVAFFMYLIVEVTKPTPPGPRFEVHWSAGKVEIDGKELLADLPNFGLQRGGEVQTDAAGGALLERAGTELQLGPASHLLLERVAPPRLLLVGGSASASGPFDLGVGAARLHSAEAKPASVRVSLDAEGLTLELVAGELDVTTPRLEEHLAAPTSLRLDKVGDRVAPEEPAL